MHAHDLGKGLRWSILAHVGLVMLVIVKTQFFPSEPVVYVPTLRVDIVGLPDILKKDLHKIKEKATLPEETKKKVKEAKKPKVKAKTKDQRSARMKNAMARIKALERVRKQQLKEKKTADQDSTLVKGNRVSPGATMTSDAREAAQPTYLDLVRSQLQEHWELPIWLSRQGHSAQVRVFVDRKGRFQALDFEKRSGSEQFDQLVEDCVQAALPFPDLKGPEADDILSNGILLGFPL